MADDAAGLSTERGLVWSRTDAEGVAVFDPVPHGSASVIVATRPDTRTEVGTIDVPIGQTAAEFELRTSR